MAKIYDWLQNLQMFIEHQFMPDIVLYTKDVRVNLENVRYHLYGLMA